MRFPFVTLKTTAAIHAEAARLYVKGIPFRRHPGEPDARRKPSSLTAALATDAAESGEPAGDRWGPP